MILYLFRFQFRYDAFKRTLQFITAKVSNKLQTRIVRINAPSDSQHNFYDLIASCCSKERPETAHGPPAGGASLPSPVARRQ